uniref:Uncharacterized protein n=1 Tax=Oryza barthii TaxID=65489 RepID=A0A0D3GCG0_9ORYZ
MDGVPPPEDGDGRPIAMEGQAAEDLAASTLAARGLVTAPSGLGFDALAVATDGHVQQNANASALATARTLLPNAPLPAAMEFNLPYNIWGICSWQLQQVQERLAAYQPSQASQCSSHGQAPAG